MALLYRMGTENGSGGDLKPFIVNFTCDSGFIGKTVTMEFQGTPHAGETVDNVSGTVASDGTLTLYPMHDGLWKYYATSDVSGYHEVTITLEKWGNYPVELVDTPNGATVTPTDDVQTWLHCANVWNKSYITISEVVADTTTLNTLIANENANDYLVRSTTFATDICNNESAMTYIGLNNYCANKLLADSTWCTAICDSPYFEKVLNVKVPPMISNTEPYGEASASEAFSKYYAYMAFRGIVSSDYGWVVNTTKGWIQYKFINPLHIYKIKISNVSKSSYFNQGVKGFDIQYSDDGINFTTAYSGTANKAESSGEDTNQHFNFNSNGYHKYWRINCKNNYGSSNGIGITDLQFYGREEA